MSLDSPLSIDQSSITGENDPVDKYLGDTCYVATGVKCGDADLMVVGTGYQTFVGRTASMIPDPMPDGRSRRKDALPRHMREYHNFLQSIGGLICTITLAVIALAWIPSNVAVFSHQIAQLVMALAIMAIPVSLDSFVSLIRSRGTVRLSEDGGLIQGQIIDSESLAGIDILCCDKTGTITENKLEMLEPYCHSSDPEELTLIANLSSSPKKQKLDPIELGIATALEKYPQAKADMDRYESLEFQPFDPETLRMQSLVKSPSGKRMLCAKGAPKAILDTCLQDHPDKETITKTFSDQCREFASRGFRMLAIARKLEDQDWELLGLAPLFDPPRPDTSSAIAAAKALGVSVKIFTGDAMAIAKSLTRSIGIGDNILDADSIDNSEDIDFESAITARIEKANVYTEIFAPHKDIIVRTLQSRGHRVAATGDGVDDAPVLRRADCGIAVDGATEKAQFASNLVFTNAPGLAPMIRGIQTSRQTSQQVYDYLVYHTTISLLHVIVVIWYFVTYSEVLDLRFLLLNAHVSDIITLALASEVADLPFSKEPQRWSFQKLIVDTIPISIMLAMGSWLSGKTTRDQSNSTSYLFSQPENASSSRSQVLFLYLVLSTHWMSLLIYSSGSRFGALLRNWRLVGTLLSIDLLATALCVGWSGLVAGWSGQGYDASVQVVSSAWVVSLGTFGVGAGWRWMLDSGDMLGEQLVIDGKGADDEKSR